MIRAPLRGALCLAAIAAALLALPALSSAHEVISLKDGVLDIQGDVGGKPSDLVTVDYDPIKNEILVGHDITNPIPDACRRDAVEPFHKVYCPADLIEQITIETGQASDRVEFGEGFGGPLLGAAVSAVSSEMTALVSTGAGADSFQGGDEVDHLTSGGGSDKAVLGAGNDVAKLGGGADKASGGAGNDQLKGGGGSDKLKGNGGADSLFGGAGSDKLSAGAGNDQCTPGPGQGHETSC